MLLVEKCVKCGKDAAHGHRVHTTQYFAPRWVYLGLLAGLLPLIPCYYIGRKTLRLSYSLCPECDHVEKRKKWIAAGSWLGLAASALLSIELNDAWILIASGILLVAAVIASFLANAPVLVSGYRDKVFTVKGVSQEFLALRGTPAG
jgi:hypothetical protein